MEDKKAAYDAQVAPLIEQIGALAKEQGIPFVLVFQTSDEGYELSVSIPSSSAHKEVAELWEQIERWGWMERNNDNWPKKQPILP